MHASAQALAVVLVGCATTPATTADGTPTTGTTAATATATQTPAPEPTPEVVSDENSQVIDGVLYQGTAKAPVRIGTDTPGQAPAVEGSISMGREDGEAAHAAAREPDKYVVTVLSAWSDNAGGAKGGHIIGYGWGIAGFNERGTWKGLTTAGVPGSGQTPFETFEQAMSDPKVLDGRTLDRAEYVLLARS